MKKAKKPFERIFVTGFGASTTDDGDVLNFAAVDDFSGYLFLPASCKEFKSEQEMHEFFEKFFQTIRQTYKRNIHAKKTQYVTNFPEEICEEMRFAIREEDSLICNEIATDIAFKDVFKHLGVEKKRD